MTTLKEKEKDRTSEILEDWGFKKEKFGGYLLNDIFTEGAFSCWLCHETYNFEVKLHAKDTPYIEKHMSSHVAAFFNVVFNDGSIRRAFYEFNNRMRETKRLVKSLDIK